MNYTLEIGVQSNYKIIITASSSDKDVAKLAALKEFQKDFTLSGFRTGHVPISLVEQHIRPEYLRMSLYEHFISRALTKIIEENKDIRFIGAPYDIAFDEKEESTIISLLLDVYPDIVVQNDWWKMVSLWKVSCDVASEERDASVLQFKKQYADYDDVDTIAEGTVTKINYSFQDAQGVELHKSVMYVGDEEVKQDSALKTVFFWKRGGESFTLDYKEKDLPAVLHYKKDASKPVTIRITIGEVKKIVLPTFDLPTIKKLFGDDSKVTSESEIEQMIEESMKEEKFNSALMKEIEGFLQWLMKDCLSVVVPKTMIEEEQKQRIKSMYDRFGGEENFKKYTQQLGEEKYQAMLWDIRRAAKESLEKFLVFRRIVELYDLKVDWDKQLDAEYKLYEKITGEKPYVSDFLNAIHARH